MSNITRSGPFRTTTYAGVALLIFIMTLTGCAGFRSSDTFRDQNMDFGSVHTVAVLPFNNLTRDSAAADRVRDVFMTALLATGGVYVLPVGEVYRGILRTGITNPAAPSPEEVVKLGKFVKADAVMVGTLREYGEVRSGTAVGYIISLSMQLMECQTGRIVWSGTSTVGGVSLTDRLFGGGGEPMNPLTQKAVNDLIDKLFS